MYRVLSLYFMTYIVFLSNRQPHKNKRHNFIFIVNLKNLINDKISTFSSNNTHILFKDNFINLIN
jgi:hypothetical protein